MNYIHLKINLIQSTQFRRHFHIFPYMQYNYFSLTLFHLIQLYSISFNTILL
nr:MAG TPA: hypothetical protein [Bacteriophage sp.]